jgi:hypothetical protein
MRVDLSHLPHDIDPLQENPSFSVMNIGYSVWIDWSLRLTAFLLAGKQRFWFTI